MRDLVGEVLTGLVQRDGLLETITRPDALLALALMGTGDAVSAVLPLVFFRYKNWL